MNEPTITINGHQLTEGQAMTVRVALGSLLMDMQEPDALGKDYHGRFMRNAYIDNVVAINKIIQELQS